MKKCAECQKEIDKFSIVCEYCGVLPDHIKGSGKDNSGEAQRSTKKNIAEIEKNIKKGKGA